MDVSCRWSSSPMTLTADGDVDDVAAVLVSGLTPVHPSVGQLDRLHFTGGRPPAAPPRAALRQLLPGDTRQARQSLTRTGGGESRRL